MKEFKGITLIALVITIIILLILAGIVISELTNDNGLFARVKEAKQKVQKEKAEEEINILLNEWQIEKTKGTKTIEEFLDMKINNREIDGKNIDEETNKIEIERNGYVVVVDKEGNILQHIVWGNKYR